MATEADLIQKFKDLNIPVGSDFEELIHEAFVGANLVDKVDNHDSRIATAENNLDAMKGSIQLNTNQLANKADDSKVLHSTVTQLTSTDMNTVLTAGFYSLNSGTNGMPNADAWTIYQVIPLSSFNGVQLAYVTNNAVLGMRSWHNGKFFSNWVKFADDSKVAHLSGANNFDTVPTVKNNPLLLASSLPSDLARTGQDTNFTGKLQKSGIDVATKSDVTTAVNTATANMANMDDLINYYHAASDDAALAAAKSATAPGIFWFEEV